MQWENSLFNRIKNIHSDHSLYAYDNGAPLSQCYLMAYLAKNFGLKNHLEIGVYDGRSFFSLAEAFKDNNGKAYGIFPYCVDEYDTYEKSDQSANNTLKDIDYEAMYQNVLINTGKFGLTQVVKTIRKPSSTAVSETENIKIDMLYINGYLNRKNLQTSIDYYIPSVSDNGLIVIDALHKDTVKCLYKQLKEDYILLYETTRFGIFQKKEKTQNNIHSAELISIKLKNLYTKLLEMQNKSEEKLPTVNVGLFTYNQEKYIVECLNSIVHQKGHFRLNIIIGEDTSTDKTAEIIDDYFKNTKLEENITFEVLKNEENLGMVRNLKRVLKACSGSQYTALMNGDDYWIDNHKIESHIAFMESHPECAITFDSIHIYDQNKNTKVLFDLQQVEIGEIFTTSYIITKYLLGTMSCCFYSSEYFDQIPEQFYEMFVGDWMLNIYYSQFGDIGYVKAPMTLYRIHDEGIWSSLSSYKKIQTMIECIDDYNRFLNYAYDDEFRITQNYLKTNLKGVKNTMP
ncbi:MAG: hypothetical protein CVU84_08905 [Firmicutes bacterium HGW-Firmicutes-1]|jgi:glycosyltransferase involved in cell wall biosynthesis|nr:MAG: hypothetical protein CVU84_08905 [Firmicutes bacterium HGW-Firmicutes-1]